MREKAGRRFVFVLNFQQYEQKITLKKASTLLYTGERAEGDVILPPFGTAVYEVKVK